MLSNESIGKLLVLTLLPTLGILIGQHYYTILPFGGICLIIYIACILFTTIWMGWLGAQSILKQNKPISYDFENNPYLKYARKAYFFMITPSTGTKIEHNEKNTATTDTLLKERRNIDDRIADFTKDVEKYFIMKWYPKISDDDTFLNETKNLLDDIIRRFLQIVVQVDNKKLVHGVLIIFLKHIKEFKRSVKRRQNNSKSVEELYRYGHVASKNDKAFEHFMCQITTKVFRQFLSWELYNSVPCKCLISILAKKLTTYVLIYMSAPPTVNYRIAQMCCSPETKQKLHFDEYDGISLIDIDLKEKSDKTEVVPQVALPLAPIGDNLNKQGNTPSVSPKRIDVQNSNNIRHEIVDDVTIESGEELIDGKDVVSKEMKETIQTDSSHVISAPVKIHKSQSSRTWRNSSDLECISLGQDLLVLQEFSYPELQIQDLIDRKPWQDNSDSLEVEEKPHPIWNISEDVEEVSESKEFNIPSPNIPSFISNTIKPIGNVTATTLHNMKEFQQSTVNNVVKPVSQATSTAMHKIGDLQDEAAGVMEGIFDFGMAGLRKGLRLTGLQDNIADRNKSSSKPLDVSQKPQKAARLAKIPHVTSEDAKTIPPDESAWMNSPNFDGQILLEKATSNASVIVPTISTENVASPDPEYEDVTDLATTTAKLRSLLQQKTSESNINTPAISPMITDDSNKTISSPLEYTGSSSIEDIEVDGALPTLYKFCARTATGVFQNTLNTLKTALPGNTNDQEHNRQDGLLDRNWDVENWMYVASDTVVDDFTSRAQRLLNERRAFCTVDNAYEAVESLDALDRVETGWSTPVTYDDELEDLEIHIPFTKTLADIFCELVSESDTFLVQESVVKILLILFGEPAEEFVCNISAKVTRSVSGLIGSLPNEPKKDTLALFLDEFAAMCLDILPSHAKTIIGRDVFMSAVKVFLSSLQSQKINQDVSLQLFELFGSLLIEASNKMTPAYSA